MFEAGTTYPTHIDIASRLWPHKVFLIRRHGDTSPLHPAFVSRSKSTPIRVWKEIFINKFIEPLQKFRNSLIRLGERQSLLGGGTALTGLFRCGFALFGHLLHLSLSAFLASHRLEVRAQIEDGSGPLRNQPAGPLAVPLGLAGVLIEIHHSFADARLLQVGLLDAGELKIGFVS